MFRDVYGQLKERAQKTNLMELSFKQPSIQGGRKDATLFSWMHNACSVTLYYCNRNELLINVN